MKMAVLSSVTVLTHVNGVCRRSVVYAGCISKGNAAAKVFRTPPWKRQGSQGENSSFRISKLRFGDKT